MSNTIIINYISLFIKLKYFSLLFKKIYIEIYNNNNQSFDEKKNVS